ncbi:MAG: M28 family peptidase, partial [Bacteroidaceae bacterium]|nr:M28 family peptidase [Bacteroidaceae bacterium]
LDMVGGRDSRFHYEGFSIKYAQDVAVRLWDAARYADATDFFRPESGGFITDDHLPMNAIAGIPTVDVIPYREGQSFTPYWHTTGDTLDKIDPATLRAVAQTVMQYLEMEKKK